MKFYNPFKPHIVSIGKYFYVRKLTICGWKYLNETTRGYFKYSVNKIYATHNDINNAIDVRTRSSVFFVNKIILDKESRKIIYYDI